MASIPLPALDIRPPAQQPDTTENYLRLKSLLGQQQLQQGQQQLQQQALQEGAIKLKQTQALNDSYKNALTVGPDGKPTFDRQKVIQGVTTAGQGSLIPDLTKTFNELDEQAGKVQKMKDEHNSAAQEYFAIGAKQIAQMNYDPSAVGTFLAHAASNGYGQEAEQFKQLLANDPTKIKPVVDSILASSKTQAEATKNVAQGKEAEAATAEKQQTAAFYQQNPTAGAPGVPVETVSMMDFMRKNPGKTPSDYKAWQAKQEAVATAPEKIAVARAEGQARADVAAQVARGSNAALAQVPPHLVGPATAAAEKAGGEFAQAQSVTQRLNDMMDAAKKGNVIAYQVIPEEGTLQITTSQGVHRINQAEIAQYAGGGSLWQRLQGHFGKALTGASIPSSVLGDMADIQKIQAEGSKTKYNNTLKAINQNYGAKFEPVEMGDSNVRSTPDAPKSGGGYWDQFPIHK